MDDDVYQIVMDRTIAVSLAEKEQLKWVAAMERRQRRRNGKKQQEFPDLPLLRIPGSSSSRAVITCDFCEEPKSPSGCFFDMVGCNHLFCVSCISFHTSSFGSSSLALSSSFSSCLPCPLSKCHGFYSMTEKAAGDDSSSSSSVPNHPFSTCSEDSYLPSFDQQPVPNPDIYCNICMESKPPNDCFLETRGCAHAFCSECIAHYVASKLEENITSVPCPDVTCKKGFLDLESCRPILPINVYDKWGAALCESSIVGRVKFYCPYKDCSALVINGGEDDEEEEIVESVCPHCNRSFCAICKTPWHCNLSCEDYQNLGKNEEERKDHLKLKEIAEANKWKRCPMCGFYVERVEGCVFIKCRCQHCFCYLCAAQMDPGSHHCKECNLTWGN